MSDQNKLTYDELFQINDELRHIIADLKKDNKELTLTINELRTYQQNMEKFTQKATVYDPNRMTDQKTLIEQKVKYAVLQKDKEIDALKAENFKISNMLSDSDQRLSDKIFNNMDLKQRNNELEEKISILEQEKNTGVDRLVDSMSQINKELQELKSKYYKLQEDNLYLKKTIKDQETTLYIAAGYISSTPQFKNQHPMNVLKWLMEGME